VSANGRKVCWGRALGAYLTPDRVVLTEVAGTPVGTAVVGQHKLAVSDAGPAEALKQWLTANMTPRQRRHTPVCVGVGAEQAFFTTRFFDVGQRKEPPSPKALLEACGAANAWDKNEAAADYVKTKLPGGQAFSLAAVKRDLAEKIYDALREAGVRSARLEPAPWSLLQAADRQAKPPRKWRVVVRVLLAEAGGLAILSLDGRPVLWRRFTLDRLRPAFSITSAVRTLQIHARRSFDIRSLCGILIQGAADDELAGQVEDETGVSTQAAGGDGPSDPQYGLALALSAKNGKEQSLDLMRGLRPPPSIRETFPWKLAALVLFLGGCLTVLLWNESTALASQCEYLDQQTALHEWAAGMTTRDISRQRSTLVTEVNAVRRFLTTRILWSNYLRDLPTRMPPNACLSSIFACSEMEDTSKKKQKQKAKKSMTLRGMARFADRGRAPKEIDSFLESLRGMERLTHDFPLVQLAEIKWRKEGKSEIAMFTVLALPKKQGN